MKNKTIIFILPLFFFSHNGFAQAIKFDFPKLKTETLSKKQPTNSLSGQHSFQCDYFFSKVFLATKRPMFCKMEDNLHKRFNVWIVFRAGLDEDYRKLIAFKKE